MKNTTLSKAAVKSMGLLCFFSSFMLLVRIIYTSSLVYSFLWWNLFLAIVPILVAVPFYSLYKSKGMHSIPVLSLFVTWLLFFPNAPYIITDLIHLADGNPGMPLWYDALMVFSFAFTGVFSGFLSLIFIYRVVKDFLKKTNKSTWFIPVILTLSGYGVYLGRVLRWNSWDMFTRPHIVFGDIYTNVGDPIAWSMTVFFTGFLLLIWYIIKFFFNSDNANF